MKKNSIILALLFLFGACRQGYKKENNEWKWIAYDEGVGKRSRDLDGIDNSTFTVLKNKDYAKDANHVYLKGRVIPDADPNTFVTLENKYSKDNKSVFLEEYKLIYADPSSFVILKAPYAKDKTYAFSGTIPFKVSSLDEFEVTESNKTYVISPLSYMIENHEDLKWLKPAQVNGVMFGNGGKAATNSEKFESFKRVE